MICLQKYASLQIFDFMKKLLLKVTLEKIFFKNKESNPVTWNDNFKIIIVLFHNIINSLSKRIRSTMVIYEFHYILSIIILL